MKEEQQTLLNRIRAVEPDVSVGEQLDLATLVRLLAERDADLSRQADVIEDLSTKLEQAEQKQALSVALQSEHDALNASYQTLARARDSAEEEAETHHRAKLNQAELRANRLERRVNLQIEDIKKLRANVKTPVANAKLAPKKATNVLSPELMAKARQSATDLALSQRLLAKAEKELERIHASRSWKLLSPLRGWRKASAKS